jgi:exodeoxyribonuclease VII large subunit
MRRELRAITSRFDAASQRLKLLHPGARLAQQEQRLDDLEQRLAGALRHCLQDDRQRVSEALVRLMRNSPDRLVREYCLKYEALAGRLQHAVRNRLAGAEHRLGLALRTLDTVSPLATLARGFAIVTRAADGTLVTDVASVAAGEEIEARVARGRLRAKVTSKPKE